MENPKRDQASPNASEPRRPTRTGGPNMWVLLVTGLVLLLIWASLMTSPKRDEIPYSYALELAEQGRMAKVDFYADRAEGMFKDPLPPLPTKLSATGAPVVASGEKDKEILCKRHFQVRLKLDAKDNSEALVALLKASKTPFEFQNDIPSQMLVSIMMTVIMVAIFIAFWLWMRRQQNQMMGGGFLSGFGKSQAKRYEGAKQAVTFADVAGIETVKAELQEIVEFLKNPEKFQKLGGRVPRGVLLNGSPGTGKTLLARAVAGEAGVPFFSVNGSEFIQMFVGVGASRVRDLFGKAKENAPAIIFIDEIDAVGRQRGAGLGGGHDEREQTLNQILGEMDGFTQTETVIVIAATNRPDVLDPALLRPGRFDRHVTVNRPTQKGRLEIFKVHVRDVPLAADVNLETLASATIGLTGADIRNLVNEAALWAARQDKTKVDMSDFDYARDKILMGPKREEVLLASEKQKTAYHEAGHTLLAWTLPGADRVRKVTIVPRGRALGVTHMMPSEERMSISEPELRDHLAVLLAGRAAEKLIYDEITVGAENDLERATGLARRMVMNWGMSDRLGPVSYKMAGDDPFLGKELHQQRLFSEHTLEMIDGEVARILRESSDRAGMLLVKQRQHLETLTAALLQQEELDEEEIQRLIGPSVHAGKAGNQPLVESLATSINGQGATK